MPKTKSYNSSADSPKKKRVKQNQDSKVADGSKKIKTANYPKMSVNDSGIPCLSMLPMQNDWKEVLAPEFEKDYFVQIERLLGDEIASGATVYPQRHLIFNAFDKTSLNNVKIVLLGQDPYHGDGQAMGLSFSVPKGVPVPPSLKNIYKEMSCDIQNFKDPGHGCLEKWASNGVLLLNATLTVRAHEPNSHKKFGWEKFTDSVIKVISEKCSGVVFLLWGGYAHKKEKLVDISKHVVLKDSHPSPLSFGKFKGCKCFSRANAALKKLGEDEMDWRL
ncbi:unnamed protein product [Lymnaea stagnalis]|uniref:Uracil-DNA glycosylase n=1 Tax=Lymnaea stagnalis TaxID=6523 RepID=A0AAV2HHK8_LYMST